MQDLVGADDWRVSVAQLAGFLELTERRVQQLAADGVIPAGDNGQYLFLASLKGYISLLQQASAGKAVSDEAKEKQRIQSELLREQRDKVAMANATSRRDLVEAGQVRDATVRLLKVLTEGADSLPDLLERKKGITGEVVTAVGEVCDQWRVRLYQRATEALGGEGAAQSLLAASVPALANLDAASIDSQTQADAAEAELAEQAKRKPGRPRLVQDDGRTPGLF